MRELPSALGHNEKVFGPAFFKKLAGCRAEPCGLLKESLSPVQKKRPLRGGDVRKHLCERIGVV
jgi:hypothetical protein